MAGAQRVVTGPVHRPRERRYTDDEVALILRRAAELGGETGPSRSEGLSLAEIQPVAREVGIDPATVARAAAALPTRRRDRLTAILGGPMYFRLEAIVPRRAEARVFLNSRGQLYAIHAATGEPDTSFGQGGNVVQTERHGRPVTHYEFDQTAAPVVFEDLVIVGSRRGDGVQCTVEPPGTVQAFHAHTGERRWVFFFAVP